MHPQGVDGEHGVRIYFTPTDLEELGDLAGTATSPRLLRKVSDASARIEPRP